MHNSTAERGEVARRRRSAVAAVLLLGVALVGCSSSSGAATGTSGSSVSTPGAVSGGPTAGSSETRDTTGGGDPTDSSGTTPEQTSTTAVPTTAAPTTTATPTTTAPTTTLLVITQGGVVIVANASGINGAASQLTDRLTAKGYATVKPTNAAGYEETLDVSKVYFTPDAYPVAYSIAQIMGVQVAPMPTPPPISYATDGLRGANVIVMLGHDLAGQPISGLPDP